MKTATCPKTWEKTKVQFLVRHKSGRYYARLFQNGKEIWKSLKTDHFSIAQAKLADLLKEHRKNKGREVDRGNAKMTFAQGAALHKARLEQDPDMKRRTREYYEEVEASLLKSWPGLAKSELRRLTTHAFSEWAARYAKAFSPSRYNGTLSLLNGIFDLAVENSVLYSNPAAHLERRAAKAKHLQLPARTKFAEFIEAMRTAQTRDAKNCSDLAQGLAFTGIRIGESGEVIISDVDLSKGLLRVFGDPDERTKNGEVRYVPLIPQARELFTRMLSERPNAERTEKLFLVHECQHSMESAAMKVGMTRITHHDLRHFFATICIESGVDIPTISRWLGHKDGGALAMRTYGHLRDEHSVAQAQKVSFAPTSS